MKDHRQQLINQVSKFTNEELLRLLEDNPLDYRLEAITYAKAEANKRGLSYSPVALSTESYQTNKGFGSKLNTLLRSRFISICLGFVLTIFIVVNYFVNAQVLSLPCYDCAIEYGVPFAAGPGMIKLTFA